MVDLGHLGRTALMPTISSSVIGTNATVKVVDIV
jgi:hypothetical protein